MARNNLPPDSRLIVGCAAIVIMVLALGLSASVNPALAAPLCGDGSAPNYGFTYDLQQAHWTVDWQDFASEQAVTEVDRVLDRLNADAIAQTMILIKPESEVGKRGNCAVHFLRYMQLGLPTGVRKDNGFVFLIVVEPESIDVHYGVGLGLPALTAYELTSINRAAEAAYLSTHSMDAALLTLVQEFDTVARENYAPLIYPTATPEPINLPSGPAGVFAVCGQLCLGVFFLFFVMWMLNQAAGVQGTFNPTGSSRSWGRGFPSGGRGFPTGSGRSSPPTRGGSGSGRSGRTN